MQLLEGLNGLEKLLLLRLNVSKLFEMFDGLKREILFFVFLTLVTLNRCSKSRPRNTGNQGDDVVSDGIARSRSRIEGLRLLEGLKGLEKLLLLRLNVSSIV